MVAGKKVLGRAGVHRFRQCGRVKKLTAARARSRLLRAPSPTCRALAAFENRRRLDTPQQHKLVTSVNDWSSERYALC